MFKSTSTTALFSIFSLLPFPLATCSPVAASQSLSTRQLGSNTLFGPIVFPSIEISNISISLFNFGDEVFDISSLSIFGDINDFGDCVQANTTTPAPSAGSEVVVGPVTVPGTIEFTDIQISFFNFANEVFDISSISIFGDVNDGVCTPSNA